MSQSVSDRDSNVKEKKTLGSVSGVDDEFFFGLAVLYLYLTREGTAAENPIYKYKRQNGSHLTSLDSLSH